MSARHVLLINPTITSARSARFPLAVLNLSAALDGHYDSSIIDGNLDRDFVTTTLRRLASGGVDAVGVSVMGGPQLPTAIAVSRAIRAAHPCIPIVWGGYFPTLCTEPSLNVPYVDYAVRGQGEATLLELLDALFEGDGHRAHRGILGAAAAPGGPLGGADRAASNRLKRRLAAVSGLSWRSDGRIVHNPPRPFSAAAPGRALPYERLADPRQYLSRTCLGRRTAALQAALGCRFRCTFCGVAAMFGGKTALPPPERLERELRYLTKQYGADSLLIFDHNFFDRESDTLPLLEVLARFQLPWWCYARADALSNLSARGWSLVRKSRLRMAYVGAESPSDWMLHDIRKGTRIDQTLEAVEVCRRHGVIPELSFMLAPPHDPEGETEKTFRFIRHMKRLHPTTEIMLYVYAPLPPRFDAKNPHVERAAAALRDIDGEPIAFPCTADEWTDPKWFAYWCHADAPWLTPRLRRRIHEFRTVLDCRFPTATDIRSPGWGKAALRALASWRYRYELYACPRELDLAKRFIRLWDPQATGL